MAQTLPGLTGVDHIGFTVPDEFFVGYGFDLDGLHRGLPDIHSLNRGSR